MDRDQPRKKRRPPAGGLDEDDDEGRILTIRGVTYRYTNGGLVEIAREPGALTDEQVDRIDEAMSTPEVNPAGNPYRDRLVGRRGREPGA